MSAINDLHQRTTAICDRIAEARRLAGVDAWCNGYGILSDPHRVRLDVAAAHAKLGEALAMLRDTRWPRDEDYDALEREHNAARE